MDISKEEYLLALDIVEEYHSQTKDKINFIERSSKYDILLFQQFCLPRIWPSLDAAITLYIDGTKCEFIEDIDFDKFATIRGVGVKSIYTIKNLLGRYKKTLYG